MFYLSKIFWLLVQPLSLACLLGLAAFLLTLWRFRRTGLTAMFLSALILFVTLYTTTGNVLLQHLENEISRPASLPDKVACLVVLGGATENEVMSGRGGIEWNAAADRYTEALRLAQHYPQAKLLISGGDGSLSGRYEGEAQVTERFFNTFGIGADRIIKENQSRNTWENTLYTRTALQNAGLTDCLLITSAFHMPRSMALFAKAGISVQPYPVDYRTSGNVKLGFDFTQPSLNAQNTSTAVREWLGLLGYRVTGRI
ncbi:YdcF family protein [Rhizobium helianthi]|uniref:YdcF family protein n=1 Tax=Rhizobium helianthi TaxID=1132695 RepID=A0ABW4M1S1_9HYPH